MTEKDIEILHALVEALEGDWGAIGIERRTEVEGKPVLYRVTAAASRSDIGHEHDWYVSAPTLREATDLLVEKMRTEVQNRLNRIDGTAKTYANAIQLALCKEKS